MNNNLSIRDTFFCNTLRRKTRPGLRFVLLVSAVLLVTACARLGIPLPVSSTDAAVATPAPAPSPVVTVTDSLPALDAVMLAHHRQCESPKSDVAVTGSARQLRELMVWLRRNCTISDAHLAPQLVSLKSLRSRYDWPEPYAAWLDEWRRVLLRMQLLQQRAVAAEAEQATMVKRLRAIERDLISRP
jgi:hypothetical protein